MAKAILVFLSLIILTNCSDSTSSNRSHYDLPTEFRLWPGSAWVYESVYEIQDTTVFDTLYISKQFNDYYGYSWEPDDHWYLVNNFEGILLVHGRVRFNNPPDTSFYRKPYIWAFFNEDTGSVDFSKYKDYRISEDKIHIGIENDMSIFGNYYDGFVQSNIDTTSEDRVELNVLITKSGFYQWTQFFLDGRVLRRMTMKNTIFSPPPEPPKNKSYFPKSSFREELILKSLNPLPSLKTFQ
ncbi:MAG: hypothetical protein D8M58_10840 [Calditrichaeota bacterium]|nr:MAG: hypothetical protein DWQ03_10215 [Calditrichota bacterium]MBL1205888.1 hypothetical protein [Calditrichota bacterium]NOG45716.1 hypothetical protein [Calditrichota bacterium]